MPFDHSSIHHTEIKRIQTDEVDGWEFICHSCGYCARYTIDQQGTQKLEIQFMGEATAYHSTWSTPESDAYERGDSLFDSLDDDYVSLIGSQQIPPDDVGIKMEEFRASDYALPYALQMQVEAILSRLG